MHPWEMKRYTLRELFYKVDVRGIENKNREDLVKQEYQDGWNRVRWQTATIANILGGKLHSVYQIATFPWDKPEPPPTEDLLSKFPKYLKND